MDTVQKLHLLRRYRRNNGPSLLPHLLIGFMVSVFLTVSLISFLGVGTIIGVYLYFAKDLPEPGQIETAQERFETTKIYDRTGQHLLYEIFDPRWGDRTIVPLEEIPKDLRNATIAIEDKSFYENPGVDLEGILRAFYYNLRGGPIQGASTITMQLVRNVLIPPEERYRKLISRKIKEVILALEISRLYSKDQILEWYLNYVYYGNLAYGVEAAARVYFDKPVQELDLAECAMLAALPQYPALNPIDNPEEARKRQHLVLDAMMRQGYITPEECVAAKYEKLNIRSGLTGRFDILAPHFSIYVRKKLEEEFGPELVHRGGLRVYTTLDLRLQRLAERIAREHVAYLKKKGHNVSNAAVVAIRPKTGEILAMVGNLDYWNKEIKGQINMAITPRQPGSSFKPFTYVTAFSQGYTPADMVMDVRTAFPDPPNPPYVPENYDRKYHGPVSMRQALACSYNMPAVKVLSMVGVKNVIDTAHRMGINTLNKDYYGLSLTLGGGEVTPLDMAYAYSVFANGGVMAGQPVPPEKRRPGYRKLDPVAILRVEDSQGHVLKKYTSPETEQVISPQLAYLITNVLSDNNARAPAFGYNSPLKLDRPAAVKTGTTNDWRDAWTIGYTPQLVCAVWVGNVDNEPMEHVPGCWAAAPIWHNFMEEALKGEPVEDFARPPGLKEVEVCSVSGKLPTEHCPHTKKELFIEGTEPTTYCDVHQAFRINKVTGKLATVYTPPELVEEKVYEIYPPEAADWVRRNGIPQPPTEYDDMYGPTPARGDVAIISPSPYAYISGGVPIIGNAKSGNFRLWRLRYGEGLNPSAWIQIGGDHYNQVENGLLDFWDVNGLEGLYTLQLQVMEGNGNCREATIQVTVDNVPPKVELIYPYNDEEYVMEDDEYVNIQARVTDNFSMDRVEFYFDNELLGTSTVPPYNQKWVIEMVDQIPQPGPPETEIRTVTHPDGTVTQEEVVISEVIEEPDGTLIKRFENGMSIVYKPAKGEEKEEYAEFHQIHVVAYDAAGNKAESGKVRIKVVHKEEEE